MPPSSAGCYHDTSARAGGRPNRHLALALLASGAAIVGCSFDSEFRSAAKRLALTKQGLRADRHKVPTLPPIPWGYLCARRYGVGRIRRDHSAIIGPPT